MRSERRVFEHLLHEKARITDRADDGLAFLEASTRIRGASLLPGNVREGDERLAAKIGPLQDQRSPLDLDELCRRLAELAEGLEDQAAAQPQLESLFGVARAQHVERSRVEAFGLAEALAALRSLARARQRLRSGGHRRDDRRPPDLAHEPARLFEVIRDDLDVLILRAGERGDPSGDPGVERGASRLGQLTIRDVPDQDVLEGVLVLGFDGRGRGGLDQVAALERLEIVVETLARLVQVRDRARPKDSAHDRGVLCDLLLAGRELVDARFDQRLKAAWDGERLDALEQLATAEVGGAGRSEHADRLFQEERIAAGVAQETFDRARGEVWRAQEPGQQGLALRCREGGEGKGAALAVAVLDERGPRLNELRPAGSDDEDGSLRPVGDVADELEQRGLGPMQVLEHEGDRPAPRQELEHTADRPVELRPADARSRGTARRRRRRADERPESHLEGSCLVRIAPP